MLNQEVIESHEKPEMGLEPNAMFAHSGQEPVQAGYSSQGTTFLATLDHCLVVSLEKKDL